MNSRRKKRLAIVGTIIGAVALSTALVLYALSQNIDLFYTPTEIVEGKGNDNILPQVGQRLRVGGLVVPGSVERLDSNLHVAFNLIDNGPAEITVEYEGILPDLFREGQGIVAQGVLVEPNKMVATKVLAKHDEEYMPPELARELKNIEHVPPSSWQREESSNEETNEEGGGYDR
ncbi:MAG: cytochrome c-type biogenesis protein CcmE [Idiomarinaceae bacterium HL-53]|nr:MAG: cytochrome c-type biogenesis protein CcmE [Idiomarinaceae bacterium HL-53]CUS47158.1 cytochrome c-type biogenesis protein CcmE [Idiomarinaceae bacterium HL-53]